jgi:acetyl/propionyl-CoA carboxylase alpha subunit
VKWIEVEFQGRKFRVPALKAQGRLWLHWKGETYALDMQSAARRSGGDKLAGQPGVIKAPMPGKVTRVAVKKGDAVTKGQALIVMEAMKMEYTLEADRDGGVEDVNVQTGQQVTLGEVLVRLATSPEEK